MGLRGGHFLAACHTMCQVSYCHHLSFGLGKISYCVLDCEWECGCCKHSLSFGQGRSFW